MHEFGQRLDLADYGILVACAAPQPAPRDGDGESSAPRGGDGGGHGEIIPAKSGYANRPQNSKEAVAIAQRGRVKKAARRREEKLRQERDHGQLQLQVAQQCIPEVAKIFGASVTLVTRKKELGVQDLAPLAHALHIPSKQNPRCGVKHRRLQALASDVVEARQDEGWQRLCENSKLLQEISVGDKKPFVHISNIHMWDGVSLQYRRRSKASKYRISRTHARQEVLNQRGSVIIAMAELADDGAGNAAADGFLTVEPWVVKPCVVLGTAASEIAVGLEKATPASLTLQDLDALENDVAGLHSCTLFKVADSASGNLLWMKWFVGYIEQFVRPRTKKILVWPDMCSSHRQHRGKIQVLKAEQSI